MSAAGWGRYLTDLETSLEERSALLAAGEYALLAELDMSSPPQDLGPLPRERAPRAQQLLHQLQELVAQLAAARAATAAELHRHRRAATSPAAVPAVYVDHYG